MKAIRSGIILLFTLISFVNGKCTNNDPSVNRINCYPEFKNKPNVTEELCLAQGCCWNPENVIPCAFDSIGKPSENQCSTLAEASRIPCRNPRYYSNIYSDEMLCNQIGCCFDSNSTSKELSCFQPMNSGYQVQKIEETSYGWNATLISSGDSHGSFGNAIQELYLEIWLESESRIRVRITDPKHQRYEVQDVVESTKPFNKPLNSLYKVDVATAPFGIAITRRSTGNVIFNSSNDASSEFPSFNGLIYENQYLELSTQLVESSNKQPRIYGLGEKVSPFKMNSSGKRGQHYTYFSRDRLAAISQHTQDGGENVYGVHPFYTRMEDQGLSHGVFFLNSNAMEVVLSDKALTFRTTGGILDFFVFMGPSPAQVVEQYTALVGRPVLPAYWHLGYHLCRWGYKNLSRTEEIVQQMRAAKIPQDVQWNDIDYMDRYAIFTLDPVNFPAPKMRNFLEDLHKHEQYYVNIHDPGISKEYKGVDGYDVYESGKALNVFINNKAGEELIGRVWPGWVAFTDFLHPNASKFWYTQIKRFHDIMPFDGMWIDMNEPSNFCDGEGGVACRSAPGMYPDKNGSGPSLDYIKQISSPTYKKSADILYPFDPFRQPYVPGEITAMGGDLDASTISMAAMQYDSLHYNVHSMYGHSELKQTFAALNRVRNKRSLIVSRSTFSGSGKYGSHWLGDNNSSWANLRDSIPGVLSMNLFGVPLVGADICGFLGNTNRELCIRWQQLGAFYPFMRNHNNLGSMPQAPVDFDDKARDLMRDAIVGRYKLLPYLYTLFYKASTFGHTVARSLVFEFPDDYNTSDIDYQFMWGSALLITPVVHKGAIKVKGYFPHAAWYDLYNGKRLESASGFPATVELDAPLNKINVHIRGCQIIPVQEPAMTTSSSRRNPYGLIAAFGLNTSYATGELFLDDGESLETLTENSTSLIKYNMGWDKKNGFVFNASVLNTGYTPSKNAVLNTIQVYGLPEASQISNFTIIFKDSNQSNVNFAYDNSTNAITLKNLNMSMLQSFTIRSIAESTEHPTSSKPEILPTHHSFKAPKEDNSTGMSTSEFVIFIIIGALVLIGACGCIWRYCFVKAKQRYQGYESL